MSGIQGSRDAFIVLDDPGERNRVDGVSGRGQILRDCRRLNYGKDVVPDDRDNRLVRAPGGYAGGSGAEGQPEGLALIVAGVLRGIEANARFGSMLSSERLQGTSE